MASKPRRGEVVAKTDELVLENIFNKFVITWFQEKVISAIQYEGAKREIDFLMKHKEKLLAKKVHNSSPPKPKADKGDRRNDSTKEQIQNLLAENQNLRTEINQLQRENAYLSSKGSEARPSGKNAQDTKELSSQNARLHQKVSDMQREIEDWQEETARVRSQAEIDLKKKENHIQKLKKDLNDLREELTSLRLRLSKLAGDKLRDGNPDIADLSDPYRPTQLGKEFSEVYDNEWSDAFEALPNIEEDKRVRLLHSIVQMAIRHCEDEFDNQTVGVKNILLAQEDENAGQDQKMEMTVRTVTIMSDLKAIRKSISPQTAKNIGKRFSEGQEILQNATAFGIPAKGMPEKVKKYAYKCAELCWLMVVCDPPMCLSEDKEKETFLPEKFKPYTKSLKDLKNPIIVLHVWPALHLHDSGPLLAKGVAQPGEGASSTNM